MALLALIAVHLRYVADVQTEIEHYCQETGNDIIGRRVYEEVEEVLIVVQLNKEVRSSTHTLALNNLIHSRLILSCQFENANLILVRSELSQNICDILPQFPLQPNESWFPSISDAQHAAYICTRNVLINFEQSTWLRAYNLSYQYL